MTSGGDATRVGDRLLLLQVDSAVEIHVTRVRVWHYCHVVHLVSLDSASSITQIQTTCSQTQSR